MIERQKLEKEEQRIREKEKKFETMVRLDVDDETDEGIRPVMFLSNCFSLSNYL